MSTVVLLLSPFWLSWKNSLSHHSSSWWRRLVFLALAACFWLGTYWVIRRVLRYFDTVYELGPALAYQLLLIILLTFLSMLLFSNLVASLSTFFLARDLELLHGAPVPREKFFFARLIQTTINSSWMVLFFSVPIFAAYGSVFGGSWLLYVWIISVMPLFLVIPAAVGILITHFLVYFLPAKRIRDVLFFIGLIGFVVTYFLFRFSQPERLVEPESFGNFMQFLSAMETPSSPFLPSSWSAEILAGSLFNRETAQGFSFALLASYALFLPVAASWISGVMYFDGWSKAQETRHGRRNFLWYDWFLNGVTSLFPRNIGAIMVKDIKTFMRDTTQWSQLFLLLALIVVYLYNFKVLPLERSPMPAGTLHILVSFANLALAGFVLSAVAVRFAFPAISLEGRAFWILQSAPVSLKALVWSKFWLVFCPLLLLGELLIFSSNLLLHVPSWMMMISLMTVFFMTLGITGIGIGLGALYPKFNYENAAEIPTSFGGAIAMILSVAFIAFAVMIEAWPVYQLTVASLRHATIAAPTATVLAPSIIAVGALTASVVIASLRIGIKSLEQLKD